MTKSPKNRAKNEVKTRFSHKILAQLFTFAALCLLSPGHVMRADDNGHIPVNTAASARRLIDDLMGTHGDKDYPRGREFLKRLAEIEKMPVPSDERQRQLDTLIREAALANPILDFDKILLVRRKNNPKSRGPKTGQMMNYHCNDSLSRTGWDNQIGILSNLRSEKPLFTPVHQQPNSALMRDLDLHFDADRFLFASINNAGNWAVFEIGLDGKGLREISPRDAENTQWFDPCYLPEEDTFLAFSTAGVVGVPCLGGHDKAASMFRLDHKKGTARQLTFEQDSGWHPRLAHDGRVMYLRWQYTDTPHYFDRVLFTMLPDGRQQKALWGSGAFFPTAFKHIRPVPGHPSMVLGVVSGHHSLPEQGRLMLVDPAMGTHYPFRHDPETKDWGVPGTHFEIKPRVYPASVTGCVQEIPGHGLDVVGNVLDNQGGECKYTFATPFPLSEKYFLASMQIDHKGTFGLYLVDRFDNFVKLHDLPDAHIFEPIPILRRKRPPVIPDMTDPDATEGALYISDIHNGRGLPGIPRGKAKALRVIAYHFEYWHANGAPPPGYRTVGEAASWDIKRVLGTVPVETDGSAFFKVPANTPIALQVLDEKGAAIQIMQSWLTIMPGENVSCTGCHENSNAAVPARKTLAAMNPPRAIKPWLGPDRPFGFQNEIQPLLNQKCLPCHNNESRAQTGLPSFAGSPKAIRWKDDNAYNALHPYVRRPGFEGDIATKTPMDYHASTSELIQRLNRGHHGVQLSREDWERLHTWIDLNAPWRGTWQNPKNENLRLKLQQRYARHATNPEQAYRETAARVAANPANAPAAALPVEKIKALLNLPDSGHKRGQGAIGPLPRSVPDNVQAPGWPFTHATATRLQQQAAVNGAITLDVPLAGNQTLRFVRIPAGACVIGSTNGFPDERPRAPVQIKKPFWIAQTVVTNGQYATFDPEHDTGYTNEHGMDHVTPGYIANHPDQPAARLSWQEAMGFCKWLSEKTGKKVTLPTEAQWEWAARAGSATTFPFGHRFADFSEHANLADASLRKTEGNEGHGGTHSWDGVDRQLPHNFTAGNGSLLKHRRYWPMDSAYPLRDDRFHDKWFTVDYVKQYYPNAWGLYDTIGNVWEWTRSHYAPYPYNENDGRNNLDATKPKVVRGGSHADRPKVVGSATRLPYESYQKVHNVGFRPIIEED
ncbi:MAG: SUMF1/EgtB/PvdO family nonheme iron enzyme [Puniceicoccales bacterium]|nr:SUMF1/EgtB/PvdO family nonheme iron enzyme [Puniceicoccales bacterium]